MEFNRMQVEIQEYRKQRHIHPTASCSLINISSDVSIHATSDEELAHILLRPLVSPRSHLTGFENLIFSVEGRNLLKQKPSHASPLFASPLVLRFSVLSLFLCFLFLFLRRFFSLPRVSSSIVPSSPTRQTFAFLILLDSPWSAYSKESRRLSLYSRSRPTRNSLHRHRPLPLSIVLFYRHHLTSSSITRLPDVDCRRRRQPASTPDQRAAPRPWRLRLSHSGSNNRR